MSVSNELKNVDPTPFQILGIEPTLNKAEVTCAYRRMILLIHPDKIRNSKINWSSKERNEAFNKIRKAYKTILKEYTFNDLPDYDIQYEDLQKDDNPITFINNIDKFNEEFDNQKKQLHYQESLGPEHIGYKEFNRKTMDLKGYSDELKKTYKPKKVKELKKHQLVSHKPQVAPVQKNYFEFGLSSIDDYGIGKTSSKGLNSSSLVGSDLSHVYNNNDTWENSAYRLKKKFNDESSLQGRLNSLNMERDGMDIDKEYAKANQNEIRKNLQQKEFDIKVRKLQEERDRLGSIKSIKN